jgi:hypothetical protein
VAPGALTRMTEDLTGLLGHESKPDEFDPDLVARAAPNANMNGERD